MKKTLALLLVCALLLGCSAGCLAETAPTDAAQQAIAERKASGNYPTVTMAFLSFTGPSAGAERVEALINAYTVEKLGIQVELLNIDIGNYAQQLQLMFASGENLDLFCAIAGVSYPTSITNGYTYDLETDDLLRTYGQGIYEAAGESSIEACRIAGTLYGVPQMKEFANGIGGIFIAREHLDAIGYDYEAAFAAQGEDALMGTETLYSDWDTVSDIFAKLHETYPDKYVFGPQLTVQHAIAVDQLGGDLFGVLFDDSTELKLEDFFSGAKFHDYCKTVYDWNQAGYISPDALTDTTDVNSRVAAGEILSFLSNTKPGQSAAYTSLGLHYMIFQMGNYFSASDAINNMPWCVSSTTQDPVAAMQVLNAFFSDPVLSNLICWGEEGVDYVVKADGRIGYPEGLDSSTVDYKLGVPWEIPNQFIAHIFETNPSDVWEQYDRMNKEAKKSLAAGFVFDNTAVANEYIALTNIWAEYKDQLMLGFVDPDVAIPELVAKLESAGLQTYIAEKQRQLDAWAATK